MMQFVRKYKTMLFAISGVGFFISPVVQAESFLQLQPRDLDGNPDTIEAYYYAPGNLTWLADANIGLTKTFGLERAEFFSDYGSEINQQGRMLREGLTLFMQGMNNDGYLGYTQWRLPVAGSDDPGCTVGFDFTWSAGENCSAPEVGEFNQFLNATYGDVEDSPFSFYGSLETSELTNNSSYDPFLHGHWLSSNGPAGRHYFSFGGAGNLNFCGSGRCGGHHVWPVHDGDIGASINACIDNDGDGWGWNGVTSCRVAIEESECVDTTPVGDGWGWNGSTSCRVDAVEVVEPECEDTPPVGDGWGWDGSTSCRLEMMVRECVDTAPIGDGWGWDGLVSCEVSASLPRLVMLSPEAAFIGACIDTTPLDNGWGWDGNASCRVLPNLIKNGDLTSGSDNWTTYVDPSADQTEFDVGEGRIALGYRDAGSQSWHSQVYSASFALEAGQTYRLEFNHSSSSRTGNAVGSVVVENAVTFEKHLERQDFSIGIGKARARVDFSVDQSDSNARLTFNLGDNAGGNNSSNIGILFLDNITLRAID